MPKPQSENKHNANVCQGHVYMIRGGHHLRYHGLWGGTGPMLAFQDPSNELSDPPVGASIDPDDVLYEITRDNGEFLWIFREAAARRGLTDLVDETDCILRELSIPGPPEASP
jgi:hypothetical protein